ncbi:MAG: signal peptidase Serine peptidase [Bryobacterales bacterium]|jgi:signal peptidase I|nr:signal peptidase Serine peptidase [Bryobacterales bacterium]
MKQFAESARNFIHEWSLNILILLFGTTTLVQAFIVPTPSMDTTVMVGDHLLVDKLSYAPPGSFARYVLPYTDVKRGDIIVFRYPMDISQNYVKRVMGVPGDHIRVVDKVVYLNGKPLDEPYVQHIFPNLEPYRDNFPSEPRGPVYDRARQMLAEHVENGELVVPPDSYFAMGDNRDNSLDSRYWGFVPRENIIGKPLLIFWSYDAPTADLVGYSSDHFVDLAKNFFVKTRWDRTLKLVRGRPIQ